MLRQFIKKKKKKEKQGTLPYTVLKSVIISDSFRISSLILSYSQGFFFQNLLVLVRYVQVFYNKSQLRNKARVYKKYIPIYLYIKSFFVSKARFMAVIEKF